MRRAVSGHPEGHVLDRDAVVVSGQARCLGPRESLPGHQLLEVAHVPGGSEEDQHPAAGGQVAAGTEKRWPGCGTGSPACSWICSKPVRAVFSPASMAATPLSRSGPGKASSTTGRSSEAIAFNLSFSKLRY